MTSPDRVDPLGVVLILLLFVGPLGFAIVLAWCQKRQARRPPKRPQFKVTLADRLRDPYVLIAGRRYLVSPADFAAVRFLLQVGRWRKAQPSDQPARWLPLKQDFRRLPGAQPIHGLGLVALHGGPEVQLLAIRLLSRCAGRRAANALRPCLNHPQLAARQQAVRSLKKLARREGLEPIQAIEEDLIAPRPLAPGVQRPFGSRLSRFLHNVGGNTAVERPPPMPWFLAEMPEHPVGLKSASWIRRLLEHIRRLVHPSAP